MQWITASLIIFMATLWMVICCPITLHQEKSPAFMKKALIRLEDIGPGGYYGTEEALMKLRVIADYLQSQQVPFHVSMIPRFVNGSLGYDKSIGDISDPFVLSFIDTIRYLRDHGASIGMHGYTHQYGGAVSGEGFEFAHPVCASNCPPDDPAQATLEYTLFEGSYASGRIREGFKAVEQSGLQVDWFSTPHYATSKDQRKILEGWVGIFFENPLGEESRTLVIRQIDSPFSNGVVYVPTRLEYVHGDAPDAFVDRICLNIDSYIGEDIAAFFYHPYLEFKFIRFDQTSGTTQVIYDDNSYLKRLIRCFKQKSLAFVPLLSLINFAPSVRQTDFFPGEEYVFLIGDVNGDGFTELIIWQRQTGTWYTASCDLRRFPFSNRRQPRFAAHWALSTWAAGSHWVPLIGDFNGDGRDDIVAWNPQAGEWRVALSDGVKFLPNPGRGDANWLKDWAVGKHWVPLAGDFNGDGRDDIVTWNPQAGEWRVALSEETQLIPNSDRRDDRWLTSWGVGFPCKASTGDFDGDGKDDVLVVDPARGDWRVALSTGRLFAPRGGTFGPWAAAKDMQPLVGKFTNDRRASICARNPRLRNGTIDLAVSLIGK